MDNEHICQIALTMLPDIGAITAKKLMAYTGSAEAVFREKRSALLKIPGIGPRIAGRISSGAAGPELDREVNFLEKHGIAALSFLDEGYPERLRNCDDGPVVLFMKGVNCLSSQKILSVVGTRNATSGGREICSSIISDLSQRFPDLVIVSGLAYGIDIVAHRTALERQLPTVGVLAHGLHTLYPSVHRDTAVRMVRQGALVTDFTTIHKPERNNFLRRNRIIAGLADATLVVESGEKGGALITAELASSYNREVFAVPGRISDTFSRGCNLLIKKNCAALVESAEDLATQLGWNGREEATAVLPVLDLPLTPEEESIVRLLETEKEISTEFASIRTGIPVHKCISLMLAMELRGWLLLLPGNQYRLRIRLK